MKLIGKRSAGKPHAAFDVAEAGNMIRNRCVRQSSTLLFFGKPPECSHALHIINQWPEVTYDPCNTFKQWLIFSAFPLKVAELFPQQMQAPVNLCMRAVKRKTHPIAVFFTVQGPKQQNVAQFFHGCIIVCINWLQALCNFIYFTNMYVLWIVFKLITHPVA